MRMCVCVCVAFICYIFEIVIVGSLKCLAKNMLLKNRSFITTDREREREREGKGLG